MSAGPSFENSLEKILGGEITEEGLVQLLTCREEDAHALFRAADQVREASVGNAVHLRGLIEFSNYCRKDCAYCGIRRSNLEIERYRLDPEQLVQTAIEAENLGYPSIVIQSGEDLWFTPERLAEIIREIKAKTNLALTLSVGERDHSTYRLWREAGADRFLLRIETTDENLFNALHPGDRLKDRMDCLTSLRELDYQLGSGVMVGLPGQTPSMLARDVLWLKKLGAEMIGVGPFIPHPATPLWGSLGGTVEQTLRLVAVLRLVFPFAHLPATTALGSLDEMGRERALLAGANVMMPNVTPIDNRSKYEIYPGKICLSDDARHCRGCIEGRIRSIGRTLGKDRGDVIRLTTQPGD